MGGWQHGIQNTAKTAAKYTLCANGCQYSLTVCKRRYDSNLQPGGAGEQGGHLQQAGAKRRWMVDEGGVRGAALCGALRTLL